MKTDKEGDPRAILSKKHCFLRNNGKERKHSVSSETMRKAIRNSESTLSELWETAKQLHECLIKKKVTASKQESFVAF